MDVISLIGLLKVELPSHTARLCDGGTVLWGAERFSARDSLLGVIGGLNALAEGVGDEVPALEATFYPPASALPADLAQPGWQTSRVRFWISEFVPATGLISGTPALMFDGQWDQTVLKFSKDQPRVLVATVVSTAERLMNRNEGNSMNPSFHKAIWTGETGHDQATGLTIPVAWGTESPGRGSIVRTNLWSARWDQNA